MATTTMDALARAASRQYGLFTAAQAYSFGFTRGQLCRMAAGHRIVQVRRGVYLFAGAPPCTQHPVVSAILAVGPGHAWASHRSAAVLWGLKGYLAKRVDLTAERQVRLAGVTVHRATGGLPEWQRKVRYGIPVTSAARTLVDLATTGGGQASTRYKLEKAWDDAERRNLLTDHEVERCAAGARGLSVAFRELLVDRVAPCDGDLAKDVLKLLLAAGIPRPELEHEVAPAGERSVFHLDMAWPDEKVAVEVEGWDAHRQRGPFDHGAARTAALAAAGWSILPVTSRTKAQLPRRLRRALAARTMKAS